MPSGTPAPGTLLWRYPTRDWVQSSPAVGPKGTIYVGSDDNLLYAFKPDGSLEWTYRTGDIVYSSPAVGPTKPQWPPWGESRRSMCGSLCVSNELSDRVGLFRPSCSARTS